MDLLCDAPAGQKISGRQDSTIVCVFELLIDPFGLLPILMCIADKKVLLGVLVLCILCHHRLVSVCYGRYLFLILGCLIASSMIEYILT